MMPDVFFIELKEKKENLLKEVALKITPLMDKFLNKKDSLAIKLHFGEEGNRNYISPIFVKAIYEKIKPKVSKTDLIECNVLYKSLRTLASSHIELAKKHGFNFAPIVIADGENGDEEENITINKKHFKEIKAGKALKNYNSILGLAHFKGHMAAGFGGALKNIGMGLGSRAGKLAMHKAFQLTVNVLKCTGCGICSENCPANAITVKSVAHIDKEKCIGCAKCIAVCPNKAIRIPWGAASSSELQERIAEYAYGILKNKKAFYINYLLDITPDCDCMDITQKPFTENIGILASSDIIAIEQASLDLIGREKFIKVNGVNPQAEVDYAEKLGLGSKKYNLIKI